MSYEVERANQRGRGGRSIRIRTDGRGSSDLHVYSQHWKEATSVQAERMAQHAVSMLAAESRFRRG